MSIQILFIQGGSEGAYLADAILVESLRRNLGPGFEVLYPAMPNEDEPDYALWKHAILEHLEAMTPGACLVGHSIGASVLIKLLTETRPPRMITGIFLLAAPFWHDHHFWRWDEVALPPDAARRYPNEIALSMYHGEDDESVPVSHLRMFAHVLPQGAFRELPGRDHQLNNDLADVAQDIKRLTAGAIEA